MRNISVNIRSPPMVTQFTRIYVHVPKDRIGVLLGRGGEVKRTVERITGTKITVDETTGQVIVEPENPSTPVYNVLKAADFVKAIACGFSPERANKLLSEGYVLEVIDLKQYVGDKINHLIRIKGRIIGENGRARRTLEEMTGTEISVYDHYVGIIGEYENVRVAREAIEMLIRGAQHSTVYKFVEREMRKIKRERMFGLWEK